MKAAFESAGAEQASAILYKDEKTFVDHTLISAFLAREVTVLDGLPSHERGVQSGDVVKIVCQLWKAPSIDKASFLDHWQGGHADLVRDHADRLGILRHVQNLPVHSPETDSFSEGRGFRKAPDDVAEIWWKNRASLIAALSNETPHPSSLASLEDLKTFLDTARATVFVARDHLVYDKAGKSS